MYYVLVQNGIIYEGSIKEFRGKFYQYPDLWSDEKVLAHAINWAEDNGWSFEYKLLN